MERPACDEPAVCGSLATNSRFLVPLGRPHDHTLLDITPLTHMSSALFAFHQNKMETSARQEFTLLNVVLKGSLKPAG